MQFHNKNNSLVRYINRGKTAQYIELSVPLLRSFLTRNGIKRLFLTAMVYIRGNIHDKNRPQSCLLLILLVFSFKFLGVASLRVTRSLQNYQILIPAQQPSSIELQSGNFGFDRTGNGILVQVPMPFLLRLLLILGQFNGHYYT